MFEKWVHLLREGSLDAWKEVEEEGICLLQGWTGLLGNCCELYEVLRTEIQVERRIYP